MSDTYEWLYDNYAASLLQEIEKNQKAVEKQLIEALALEKKDAVVLSDAMVDLRLQWGGEIFALGLQLGLRLVHPNSPLSVF